MNTSGWRSVPPFFSDTGLFMTADNGKTRMTIRQAPFQSIAERNGHVDGWTSAFDRLDEHLLHQGRT